MDKKDQVIKVLPMRIRRLFQNSEIEYRLLQEIRLRGGQPIIIKYRNEEFFLREKGGLGKEKREICYLLREEIIESLEYISNYSLYAYENQIKQGFITVLGGHRVGIAGKVLVECGKVKKITNVGMINIRLSHEVIGCARPIFELLEENGQICHTMIISPPGGGKTTLLRDLARMISESEKGLNVGIVDERSEIAACYKGIPQNDVGIRSDVLDGCPKSEGMLMLIRSMSPQVLVVDELGAKEDIAALQYAMNCGCKILATIHGSSLDEIMRKPFLREIIDNKLFQRFVLLGNGLQVGTILNVYNQKGQSLI